MTTFRKSPLCADAEALAQALGDFRDGLEEKKAFQKYVQSLEQIIPELK